MTDGIIYILTNPAIPDYIKIGYTAREDIKKRLNELYSTGVPFPFKLHYAVKVENAKEIESKLHKIFSIHRENMDREFFKMDPERAKLTLDLLGGTPITLEDNEIYEPETIEIIQKSRQALAPAFRFSMVNIPIGSELTFSRDDSIKCTVVSDKEVEYQGQNYSLTGLVKILLNIEKSGGIRGPQYWQYEGKLLTEIRKELEELEKE